MKKNSMNSSDVAKKIDVSHTTITRILAGSIPTSMTLYRLSILFNVSMEYILLGEDIKEDPGYCIVAESSRYNVCANAHSELIEKYSQLNTEDQVEIIEIINLKLNKSKTKNVVKSSHSEGSENSSVIA